MTKTELILDVQKKTELSNDIVTQVINAAIYSITEKIASGEEVVIPNFGVFSLHHRSERKGHNISTGKPTIIEAHKLPHFRAFKSFKALVNK